MATLIKTSVRIQPGKILLVEDELVINAGLKYGLLGENGSGKTTLLNWCRDWITDKHKTLLRVGYVEQNISSMINNTQTVVDYLVGQDTYNTELMKQKLEIEKLLYSDEEDDDEEFDVQYYADKLSQIEDELRDNDSHTAVKRAKTILEGLGFNCELQVSKLSGGWVMRLQLAKLLYLNLDIVLLDEPTNHLDVDAIEWLEDHLSKLTNTTLIMISHDYELLERVCDRFLMIDSSKKKLTLLKGLDFEPKTDLKKKVLFDFNDDIKYGHYEIQLHELGFGYKEKLFSDIDLCLDTKSKIGILGANGTGKSTLLKLITQELKPTTGKIVFGLSRKLRIFRLHQIIDLEETTAIQFILNIDSKLKMQDARMFLGKAGLDGKLHSQKVSTFSGGQKSRLMIAKILVLKPHILLLDEPTNHLDLEGTNILLKSIKGFNGGLVVVSHDRRFIHETCDTIYELKDKKLRLRYRKK